MSSFAAHNERNVINRRLREMALKSIKTILDFISLVVAGERLSDNRINGLDTDIDDLSASTSDNH